MPRRDLLVVGNHLCRCNNSDPRYKRENHYAISCTDYEFPTFTNHKISITLLYFPKCRGRHDAYPTAKLSIIFGIQGIIDEKIVILHHDSRNRHTKSSGQLR